MYILFVTSNICTDTTVKQYNWNFQTCPEFWDCLGQLLGNKNVFYKEMFCLVDVKSTRFFYCEKIATFSA